MILITPSGMSVRRVMARWIEASAYETSAANPVRPRMLGAMAKIATVK
jgi:hypothetical protein